MGLCKRCLLCSGFLRAWGELGARLEYRLMRLFHILFFHISEKVCIFASDLVTQRTGSFCCKGIRLCSLCVKRESGESPEQSRCCKLFIPQLSSGGPPRMMKMPLCGAIVVWEGGELWGVSQKTCQIVTERPPSDDLKLSRKELEIDGRQMPARATSLFTYFR